jgi:1-phosphofructokinase/tagatose 6-phosphate kinase
MRATTGQAYLCVCLNPVIQKTLVFPHLVPGEVNRSQLHRVDASGKGVNVARVLAQTGRPSIHLTQAGGVNRGWFLSMCAADGLDVRTVDSGSEIRFCHTVIDQASGLVTELVEEADPVGPETGERLLAALDAVLPECRAVIVSGTKAAGFGADIVPEVARRARAAGLPLILDVKGADLMACLPLGPIVAKPNLAEFLATWPLPGPADAAHDEAALRGHAAEVARELHERFGSHLVLTRGAKPTWYWDGGDLAEEVVADCRPLNTTGSGDAFTAGLAAALVEGGTLRDAIREGTRLGALNAGTLRPGSIR